MGGWGSSPRSRSRLPSTTFGHGGLFRIAVASSAYSVEFQAMVEDKIREEVLYREGLAMGLDKDDTIVKRRMAQKVQFLAEDVAAAHEPSTAELKAWFDKNTEKFALPSRYSFRHIYFSPDKRGKNAKRMLRRR